MSRAYIETVENFLSSELNAGFDVTALDAVRGLTEDQFAMFVQHWHEVDRQQHEIMTLGLSTSRVGAVVAGRTGRQPQSAENIAPTSALFAHPYNSLTGVDLDLVKRQALLFSRVAVVAPSPGFASGLPAMREKFSAYLNSMLDLKPLIEDSTIELIPLAGFCSNEIEGGAAIVRAACEADPTIRQWVASRKEELDDFSRAARKGDPFFDAGIRICAALNYGHTLAATHPFVGGLYKQLVTDAPRQDRSLIAATNTIDRIELPGFVNLSWGDIKSLRDNEECFARWRADLHVAITSVDPDLPSDKFVERFDSQVQAQLKRAALDLDKDLKTSSASARFKKGWSSLLLSAAAATARVVIAGPAIVWAEVINIARKEGPKEAIRLLWERKDLTGKQALRKHYMVFSQSGR